MFDDPQDELPPLLAALLERELLTPVDIESFWARADALTHMLPDRDGNLPSDFEARRVRAREILSDELVAAVDAIIQVAPASTPAWALRDLLEDWEALRLDQEKLLGHLLLHHGEPPEGVVTADQPALVQRHADHHPGTVRDA